MVSIKDYSTTEKLRSTTQTELCRASRTSDKHPVFLNILSRGPWFLQRKKRFEQDFEIGRSLDIPSVLKPLKIEECDVGIVMVLEDFGGVPLDKLLAKGSLDLSEVVSISLLAAEALGNIHSYGITHKDIRPENLIYNAEADLLKITGFGIANVLKRETPNNNAIRISENELAYISPEQTGRMNRSLDFRTDFYSLGVTIYHCLTGRLPFIAEDDIETTYCLLAREPVSPLTIDSIIPSVISEIVMKLLSKSPEDRYQSAFGLASDLRNCQEQLRRKAVITHFKLGQQDRSEIFTIPEKLYGREQQVDTLIQAFKRTGLGKTEMMLVAGYSGVGKSALINELRTDVAQKRGYFIGGKCDQYKHHIPYSAMIDAFDELIQQILTETEERIDNWKRDLIDALAPNGQVLIDVIPALEQIIGSQPIVVNLAPGETQNRFDMTLINFLNVFTQGDHRLVMALDDLQWVDPSSLRLLDLLMTGLDSRNFLMLGAYRDNEVDSAHPLMVTLGEISSTGATVRTLHLAPLALQDVTHLCADTLGCRSSQAEYLAQLVFDKTKGNPFFLKQFMQHLDAQGALAFDFIAGEWRWNTDQIRDMSITDNVVELLTGRIGQLPTSTREALKLAACIGNHFNLNTLAIVSKNTPAVIKKDLWNALLEEIIVPLSAASHNRKSLQEDEPANIEYRFLHDRVQEAAYSLIPANDRKSVHLRIGLVLKNETFEEDFESVLFDVVNHLNIGSDLIDNQHNRKMLARLNLQAGRKAKMSTAYADARRFLIKGIDLLPEGSWINEYDLTLSLYVEAVEIEYLNTNFKAAQKLSEIVVSEAQNILDQVKVHVTRVEFLITQNRMIDALDMALPVLEMLGYPISMSTTEFKLRTPLPRIEDLDSAPKMTDPMQLAAVQLLTIITGASYQGKPELFAPIAFKLVTLCHEHGLSSLAAYAYGVYACLLCGHLHDIENGYHAGTLAIQMLERFPERKYECKIHFVFNSFIRHWKEPNSSTLPAFANTVRMGLETGDFVYVAYCRIWSSGYLMLTGHKLPYVEEQQREYLELMNKLKQENGLYPAKIWRQLTLNLQGASENKYSYFGNSFNREDMRAIEDVNVVLTLFFAHFSRLIQAYIYGDYEMALNHANATSGYEKAAFASMLSGGYVYYDSLARLAAYSDMGNEERHALMVRIDSNLMQLRKWSRHAPFNFRSKVALVEAEKARVDNRITDAMRLYDKSCRLAKEDGFLQENAMAAERAHDFYTKHGLERFAEIYIKEAYDAYCIWGASGKAKDLEKQYPDLLVSEVKESSEYLHEADRRPQTLTGAIDTMTLLKASQALSVEIERDGLLAKLMRLAIENAGARRGVFVLNNDGELKIETVATDGSNDLQEPPSDQVEEDDLMPSAMVRLVARTRKTIVLGDATIDATFAQDHYITNNRPRSILCAPICYHDQVVAIIYLENDLSANVFTSERLTVLNVLLAQAAISLDNVNLFEKYKLAEKSMRHLRNYLSNIINSMPSVLVGVDPSGIVTQWNTKAQQTTGVSAEEAVGRPLTQSFPRLAIEIDQICNAMESMEVRSDQMKFINEDGEICYEDVTVYPLLSSEGEGAVIRVDDVTERMRIEDMMVQSEKMLSVGGLAAGMAHEINNPLAGMIQTAQVLGARLTNLDLLANKQAAEKSDATLASIKSYMKARGVPGMLDSIHKSGERAAQIVSNMLSFARKSDSTLSLHNIADLLDQSVDLAGSDYDLKKKYDFRRIKITREYEADLPQIPCEAGKIQQVFLNILRNGAETMQEETEKRGIKISQFVLRLAYMNKADKVRIEIEDNGPGMDETVRKRVFEPFFTTKATSKGTGLGLSVSYFIITENHDGEMRVESNPGSGTTFIITLPVERRKR